MPDHIKHISGGWKVWLIPALLVVYPALYGLSDSSKEKETIPEPVNNILEKNRCNTCHMPYKRLVGPSFQLIASKNYSATQIAELIAKPKPENWPGFPAMAPVKNVPFSEIKIIAAWINTLKKP